MILFLFGEDTFRLFEKVKDIKARFREKDRSGMNFMEFRAETFTISAFGEAVRARPFLAKSRLVCAGEVFSYPASEREALVQFLTECPETSNVVVLWHSGAPDERTKLFKLLVKSSKVQEFPLLDGRALREVIEKMAGERGVTFEDGALDHFIGLAGNNLWQADSALRTLAQYSSRAISHDDIDQFVVGEYSSTIFEALEALASRNRVRALQLLHEQLSLGQHPLYILTMLAMHFRQLLLLSDLHARGIVGSDAQKISKLHPFVVKKLQPALRRFQLPFLRMAFEKLVVIDRKVKTGEVSALVAIDLFVVGVG